MKCAGLIFDHSSHYIDHLAPFCSMMSWPLLVCEPSIGEICRAYYPNLNVIEIPFFNLKNQLPEWIVSCDNRTMLDAAFGFFKPDFRMIWLPHGLSDKGWESPYFEALGKEELLLIYGRRMADHLAAKKISLPAIEIGSYRFHYFQNHRPFYENLLQKQFQNRRFILYAPSWEDAEKSGMFWEVYPKLIQAVPSHLQLLIKVHPNTERRFPAELERCKGLAPQNIQFLEDFPPIYPILSRADAYIGDRSSIGYDFLHFKKPLFFTTQEKKDPKTDPSAHLMQSGHQIYPNELPSLFANWPQKKIKSDELLRSAFSAPTDWIQKVNAWI